MNFREITKTRMVPRTIDGITNEVSETYTEKAPRPPRDWNNTAVAGASTLVLALTAVAVVWSTVSIGSLLNGGVGYAAAAMFDVAWAVTILLEWLARYDSAKRTFARRLGWVLLFITMGAIFWHGLVLDSLALAVVGAMVSFVAKVLWLGILKHVDRDLSAEDRQWVEAEISKANAKEAIAQVRRRSARAEARAAMELVAAEHELNEVRQYTGRELGTNLIEASVPASISASDNASNTASITASRDTDTTAGTPATDPAVIPLTEICPDPDAHEHEHQQQDEPRPLQPPAPEPKPEAAPYEVPEDERVPEQRPPSVRAAVAQLYSAGMKDQAEISKLIAHLRGEVTSPDTIGRYLRDLKNKTNPGGGYL